MKEPQHADENATNNQFSFRDRKGRSKGRKSLKMDTFILGKITFDKRDLIL
jgi:hypothetical protein